MPMWIVDGGHNVGVMKLIGDMRQKQLDVPMIGVAAWRKLDWDQRREISNELRQQSGTGVTGVAGGLGGSGGLGLGQKKPPLPPLPGGSSNGTTPTPFPTPRDTRLDGFDPCEGSSLSPSMNAEEKEEGTHQSTANSSASSASVLALASSASAAASAGAGAGAASGSLGTSSSFGSSPLRLGSTQDWTQPQRGVHKYKTGAKNRLDPRHTHFILYDSEEGDEHWYGSH